MVACLPVRKIPQSPFLYFYQTISSFTACFTTDSLLSSFFEKQFSLMVWRHSFISQIFVDISLMMYQVLGKLLGGKGRNTLIHSCWLTETVNKNKWNTFLNGDNCKGKIKASEVKSLSRVWLFATPWIVAHQAPRSMGFSRHEYWSGLPFPSPGDLPDPGIEPRSPTLEADALSSELPGKFSVFGLSW